MNCSQNIALGTWKSKPEELKEAIRYAIEEAGYRRIDCAFAYENESSIGEALQDLFKRNVVKREDLWITSKLWNTYHRPDLVEEGCRKSLQDLQLDYLDEYLMHCPCAFVVTEDHQLNPVDEKGVYLIDHVSIIDTWKAMEKLVEKGIVKRIGVSNFTTNMLERLRYCKEVTIQPYANQIEFHLFMQQEPLREYLTKRNIIIEAYSPLGSNDFRKPEEPHLLEDEVLVQVSKEVNQPVASVALRFLLMLQPNAVIIPKSVTPERIKSNISLGFSLNEDQVQRLKGCERFYRYVNIRNNWGLDVLGDGW